MGNDMRWVDIPGWEARYQISENGDVQSKDMRVNAKDGGFATRKGRILAPVRKNNGYLCVTLTDGVNRPQIAIHRLVARAFIGECPIGLHVLHGDGNKENNHYSNLRYGTPAENHEDTKRHGRRRIGETNHNAKVDAEAVLHIRNSSRSGSELAKMYGLTSAHVSAIRRRRVWAHI
jgi:hypothetical protein